jgi:hypothetical protein
MITLSKQTLQNYSVFSIWAASRSASKIEVGSSEVVDRAKCLYKCCVRSSTSEGNTCLQLNKGVYAPAVVQPCQTK